MPDKRKGTLMDIVFSGITSKGAEKRVCVSFSEKGRSAEGYVPSCKIERNSGFTADEVRQMEAYLEENKYLIWEEAKKINPLRAMWKE